MPEISDYTQISAYATHSLLYPTTSKTTATSQKHLQLPQLRTSKAMSGGIPARASSSNGGNSHYSHALYFSYHLPVAFFHVFLQHSHLHSNRVLGKLIQGQLVNPAHPCISSCPPLSQVMKQYISQQRSTQFLARNPPPTSLSFGTGCVNTLTN